jgi:hypothetical protein
MERYERKNNGGNPQRTPRSRSNAFPHKEDILIGRIVDLNLLSLFPQEYAGIMGGRGGELAEGEKYIYPRT